MKINKEDILHIADLAHLNLEEDKIDQYVLNLQDILNFANIVNKENVENLDVTVGANEAKNIFRKDEINEFKNIEGLMENAPDKSQNMFKIPKVL